MGHCLTAAALSTWLLAAVAPAQHYPFPRRGSEAVRPGTTVQATLAAPAAKVPFGAPIRLEASVTASADWHGHLGVVWERRLAQDQWQEWENKSPEDPLQYEVRGGAVQWFRLAAPRMLLHGMQLGVWRAQLVCHWTEGAAPQQAASAYCTFEVVAHPGNQQLLAKAATQPMLSAAANAWSFAVDGAWLGEDLPPIDPARLAALGGRGMMPVGTPMADMARELAGLRAQGAALELVVAAELVLARRELERLGRLPEGPARAAAVAAVRATLEALARECPGSASPLAGLHGEVRMALGSLLCREDPQAAADLVAATRERWPALAGLLPAPHGR